MERFLSHDPVYRCFAYGRLSKEDADRAEKQESNSIVNQRALLHDYIDHHSDLQLVMEGYDDGLTGTNFDRPHFQRMLRAIQDGQVNCVVVKDLSRFGREYIEAGRFIEKLFPQWGVRFIAIVEGYDTAHLSPSDSLMLPFKNLVNDSYSRDTSIKIRSHLDVKRRNGDFIGSFAAYGYRKDPDNKNHLLVDLEPAAVVQDIFAWRLAGMSNQGIADKLTAMGVLSPMEYKRAMGEKFKSGYKVHAKASWSAVAVRRILTNVVYLGTMEQGKRTTPNYKVRSVVHIPEDEWMRVEHTHESIVSQEDFDLVQRLLLLDTNAPKGQETVYPLAGLLYCGDCMGTMVRKNVYEGKNRWQYYTCGQHKHDKTQCSSHMIRSDQLESAVLEGLNLHIRNVVDLHGALTAIERQPSQKIEIKKLNSRVMALEAELGKARELKDSLYRRYAMGEVEAEDFQDFKRIFTQDCERLETALTAQRAELDGILSNGSPDSPWIGYFKRFGQINELTRSVAVRLIDHVLVYEEKRLEIVFRYQTEYEQALQFLALHTERTQREAG